MANKNDKAILVIGATGFLGMEICSQLVQANRNVKALVRVSSDPAKVQTLQQMGIETVTGDMKDISSLNNACINVSTVISTASATLSRQSGDSIETVDNDGQLNVVAAAEKTGVQQFIYISFNPMAQEFPLQTAKRAVEKQLMEGKMNYTILQPTVFMEVWLSPNLGFDYGNEKATIYGEGTSKLTWISLKDVASFAVGCVDNPAARNMTLALGGPDALSSMEVVAIFEQQTGKRFKLEHVPLEALKAQKNTAPDSLSQSFAALMMSFSEESVINMQEPLKICPMVLTSVKDYAQQVMPK